MKILRWTRILALLMAVSLSAPAGLVTAAAQQTGAEVTVTGTGQVRIDGAAAATGATLFSGSRVTTDANAGATVTIAGSRVTLGADTDAVISFTPTSVRVDVVCGTASAAAAPGTTFELVTHDDTNVHVQTGSLRVAAEGKTAEMGNDEQQSYADGARITAAGGTSFETATILCSCKCAAPTPFPVAPVAAAGGIGGGLLAAIIAGAAAAVLVPVIIDQVTEDEPVVSP